MGLFDNIKKNAPHLGVAVGTAAAGAFAGKAVAEELEKRKEANRENTPEPTPNSSPKPTTPQVDNGVETGQNTVGVTASTPEVTSVQDSATGAVTRRYPNGNVITEYPDGSRKFYDVSTGQVTAYNAQTGETTTYESDGDVVVDTPDGYRTTYESDGDIRTESPNESVIHYDPSTGNTIVDNYDGLGNTGVFNADGELISTTYIGEMPRADVFAGAEASGSVEAVTSYPSQSAGSLFADIMQANSEIPSELKAAGLGIPEQPVQEFHPFREGSLEDGQIHVGYRARYGLESTHSTVHKGQDEIALGTTLNSEATYKAQSFVGASSQGDFKAEWNSEQAHLQAQGRSMIGAEANAEGSVKETLEVDGLGSAGGDANLRANAFAGAESKYKGNATISRDSANLGAGGSAFAGARASADGNAGLSADGNEFARVNAGVEARAGIGVDGNFNAGFEDGEIKYDMGVGGALGVGAGYRVSGSVDAPGILTHPDAVAQSLIPDEYDNHVDQAVSFVQNPSNFVEQQAQDFIQAPIENIVPTVVPEPINQVAEVASNFGNNLDDLAAPSSWLG